MNYAVKQTPPRTLSAAEQRRVLRATGERVGGMRDHLIIALALHAGLREHEIAALDVGDLASVGANVYVRKSAQLRVFKNGTGDDLQEARLPDSLRRKIAAFLRARDPLPVAGDALFPSRENDRISTRRIRELWSNWQRACGFDRHYRFHDLRHTFCSSVYRASGKDVLSAMHLARHKRVETTMRYTHPNEDELRATLERIAT